MNEAISYKIYLDQLTEHVLNVECTIMRPSEEGQVISLPNWVPGSYLIRDFAKNIVDLAAYSAGKTIAVQKILKNTWQCAPCKGPLVIKYQAYCFDLAPRGAYVDNMRVFFDGCRIFLVIEGEEEQTRSVEIIRPKQTMIDAWRCITSMTQAEVDPAGFGTYVANNHLELIDHPFAIGDFDLIEFIVAEVPHYVAVFGAMQADLTRFAQDLGRICAAHVDFFGELPDLDRYVFILVLLGKGYGGLEHRASTSLLSARNSLPIPGNSDMSEDYRDLLGLASHEYFHLWNVKRIKPEVFTNLDLNNEVYTRQLWIFEGITSYYDNLNMIRARVINIEQYLDILRKEINSMIQNPGTNIQTLEEASFDAWIKYYQPDENTLNATVSYYIKGALVALALDLLIIRDTQGKQSLADVMQVLWQQYGKTGLGLPEEHFARVTYEVTGQDYADFFALALRSTEPLPLPELLLEVGVIYKSKPATLLDNLGLKLITDQNRLAVRAVINGTAAQHAGIAANDILIAINEAAVSLNNIENIINRYAVGDVLYVHLLRNDWLIRLELRKPAITETECELQIIPQLSAQQKLYQDKWFGF